MRGDNMVSSIDNFSIEDTNIENLINLLSSKDGIKRQAARNSLVKIGKSAIPFLEENLNTEDYRTRWEIIKTLSSLPYPESIPAYIKCLNDENEDIRWIAAEGMIELEKHSIKPLLRAILSNYESVYFCEGAHHILKELVVRKLFSDTTNLIPALINKEMDEQIPIFADVKLAELNNQTSK